MLIGLSATLHAEESAATMTWIDQQYIWVDEASEEYHYYLTTYSTIWDGAGILCDGDNDGVDDITKEVYDQMYSWTIFENLSEGSDPIDDQDLYDANLLTTYELESTSFPKEITFKVVGQKV